jgi:hypothetical protein
VGVNAGGECGAFGSPVDVFDTLGVGRSESTSGVGRRCRTGACPAVDVGAGACGAPGVSPGWFRGEPPWAGVAPAGEGGAAGVGATVCNCRAGQVGAALVIRPGADSRCTLTTGMASAGGGDSGGAGPAGRDATGNGGIDTSRGCGCPTRLVSNP